MSKDIRNLIILVSCIAVVMVGSAFAMKDKQEVVERESVVVIEEPDVEEEEEELIEDPEEEEKVEEEPKFVAEDVTALLLGVDYASGNTDVIMVVHFDAETNEVKLISVPRDYHIDFRQDEFEVIYNQDRIKGMPRDQKITEVIYNLTKRKDDPLKTKEALYVVEDVVSVVVNLEIEHLAVIDTSGFRDLVDIAGGVDFYVPQRMYKPIPDQNLYIDLEEGQQHLDGDKAEQLIRFREYRLGDLTRIQVQQDFIEAFYKQVAERANLGQIVDLTTKGYDLFDSDFGMATLLDYTQYIFELDPETVLQSENMITLPWYYMTIGKKDYLGWDMEKAHQAVDELINGPNE